MLVLDTHTALWWTLEPFRLGSKAAAQLEQARQVGIPTIVFWEAALLVRKRKLKLDMGVAQWASRTCSIPRVEPLPLTAEIALSADGLQMHPDPADRFIVATALAHQATVVTKDDLIGKLRFVKSVW